MSVIDDLLQFFLPEPTPRRMEKKEPPPPPRPRPRRPQPIRYKKRPGGLTKFTLETAQLPASVVDQIDLDIRAALAFRYTGRADYRQHYLEAGVPIEDIPEEEMEELPGAEGIKIPILGWEVPSKQVRKIAQNWWESVTTWSDISLVLEGDFVWKPLLADWGIENLRVIDRHPVTGQRGKFVVDAAGNVLETVRQVKEEYPLTGALLDWLKYGETRPDRVARFPLVKEEWLKYVQPQLVWNEPPMAWWDLRDRIRDAVAERDADVKKNLINELWRDFVVWSKQGYTFGISETALDVLKVVEYRGLQFEAHDFLDLRENNQLFRSYVWAGFLRPEIERRTAKYLVAHPRVKEFLRQTFSPIFSRDLTDDLLARGRLLPNRLITAFLRRVFKQRFPKEVLVRLRGELAPDLFRQIRGQALADLEGVLPARAYNQLKNSLYVQWRSWFLPGRFMEWAGRNLTKIQQTVVGWLEEQMVKGNRVGRFAERWLVRLTGRRAFVEQALGRRPLTRVPVVAAARRAVARVAWGLRRVSRKAAQLLVKAAQGASKLTGPVGAAITVAVTFFGGRLLAKLWDKTKGFVKAFLATAAAVVTIPVSLVLAATGCSCAFLLAPFLLLVFIIAPAFQPGGTGSWPGPAPALVRVEKTVTPNQVAVGGPHPLVNYKLTVSNPSATEAVTAGTLIDEYDPANFTPSVLDGADNSQPGELVWTIDSIPAGGQIEKNYDGFINSDADKRVVNRASFSGLLAGESVSDTASAVILVGTGGD